MAWDPKRIVEILQECGTIAVDIQLSARRSIKADGTIVTEADKRIEAVITESLKSSAPTPFFIGEETSQLQKDNYHHTALENDCYVIDPIDGTTLYAHRLPGWGISIGYMVNGSLSEGAILFPLSGELLISRGDEVLYASTPGRLCPSFDELSPLSPPNSKSTVMTVNQAVIKQGCYTGNLTVLSTGSCVSSILYLTQGMIIAYVTHSKLWDLAGGIPLLFKLGIRAYSLSGKELSSTVSKEYWHVPPVKPGMLWAIREPTLLCAGPQTFEDIMRDMTIPR